MLKTQIDIVSLIKTVSSSVADSFEISSLTSESETARELIENAEKHFDSVSHEFLEDFRVQFQTAFVTELIKQLSEQNIKFD